MKSLATWLSGFSGGVAFLCAVHGETDAAIFNAVIAAVNFYWGRKL